MMLITRDVVRYPEDGARHFRVIWGDSRQVILFDLDSSKTALIHRDRAEVEEELASGVAEILLDHAFDAHPNPAALTDKQKDRRKKLFDIIEPLLQNVPDIFDRKVRGQLVAELERARTASAKTVHEALDRYWRRGMSIAALTPAFSNCGSGPRRRGTKKLGRPRQNDERPGVNTSPEIEKVFDIGLRRFYVSNRKNSLKAAYDMMVADFFAIEVIDPSTGKRSYPPKPEFAECGYPSFRQFRFWYDKRDDLLEIRRKRVGNSKYEKDMRGITGTAVAGLMGIGSRFEIDSTPLDIGAVSVVDRTLPVNRPTFYQVTDVLTKLVCGIYVGFEEASWLGAELAVRNVVADKGDCQEFRVWAGIMGKKESHYVPTQGAGDPG